MYARLFYLTIALGSLSFANGLRILGLFPHIGKSHHMVFQPLLSKLAERGNDVTVVSFFPLKEPQANYTDVSLAGLGPEGIEMFDVENAAKDVWSLPKQFGFHGIHDQLFIFFLIGDMAVNFCQKMVNFPPLIEALKKEYDVVLIEYFNSDCMLGLVHAFGVKAPVVGLSSCTLWPGSAERLGIIENPSYQPILSTSFVKELSFLQRLENSFLKVYFDFYFRSIRVLEQGVIEKAVGRKIEDLDAVARRRTSLLLSNTHHSLHGRRPLVPALVEAGGMHLKEELRPIPRYMEDFLNESKEGVVLFSWGSLIKTSTIPPHKEEVIVRALSQLPQRVIWKYENSGPEGNLTGNILRVNWIPQYELLQHKKVLAFIAHGGLLGMTEAISAGKPMLVVPFFGDQPNNGAAAAAAGFGVVLPYADITEYSLHEALKKVLSPEFRLNARQASAIWHDRPAKPLDTAVYWVERVARWGDAAPLHHPARDMPFYQRALLDVIAVTLATLIFAILLLRLLCKLLIKAIMSLFAKEKKKKVN